MDAATPNPPGWQAALRKTAIWAGLIALVYLARDFFFVAFMTFLFSYLTLSLVGWAMGKLRLGRRDGWTRVLLTLSVFVAAPLVLLGLGALIAPPVIEQTQRLAGYFSHVSPEAEVARLLEGFVGPRAFKQQYPDEDGEAYKKDLAAFREQGVLHARAYNEFPTLQAVAEGGFRKQHLDAEQARLRARLVQEGTAGKEFEEWFAKEAVPRLRKEAAKEKASPLARAALVDRPEVLLAQARHDPAELARLREEWLRETLAKHLAGAPESPAYLEQFRAYYEKWEAKAAHPIPYTFDEFLVLQKARQDGPKAFGEALEKMKPSEGGSEARLARDFEASRSHELFLQWWGTSAAAKFIRRQLSRGSDNSEQLDKMLHSFLNIPVDLGTALLLSLFICLDYPNLRDSFARLRQTWLREAYDETVPALSALGTLVGRAMYAQGLVAACNAGLVFVGLWLIGVEHQMLVSLAVFVLCLVPTLGIMLSLVVVAVFALIQPGGGMPLALKAAGVVMVVLCVETFVLSPRILGKLMEIHPVLIIGLLPVAQYFFGVWGLILATPLAVYVIHVLVMRRGLPGSRPEPHPARTGGQP